LNVEVGKPNKQTQEMIIKHLDTGVQCIIKWVSSKKNAGRSIANWKIVIDEAAFVSDEAFLAGGLSATIEKGKTMFAISTPNPDVESIMDTLTKDANTDEKRLDVVDVSLPAFCPKCEQDNLFDKGYLRCKHMVLFISTAMIN